MKDAERLDALRNLFIAGPSVTDGARKVVGLILSIDHPFCRHEDICDAFGTSRTTAYRWIAEARDAGLIPASGLLLRLADVDLDRLRELAGVTPRS